MNIICIPWSTLFRNVTCVFRTSSCETLMPIQHHNFVMLLAFLFQSYGKSSVLESVVSKDFIPLGSSTILFYWYLKLVIVIICTKHVGVARIVTRWPLMLQLHEIDERSREYTKFITSRGKVLEWLKMIHSFFECWSNRF